MPMGGNGAKSWFCENVTAKLVPCHGAGKERRMYTSVNGYYNGSEIVMDETVAMRIGQRVIVTILPIQETGTEYRQVKLDRYVGRGEKMFHGDAGDFVKELRTNDRE